MDLSGGCLCGAVRPTANRYLPDKVGWPDKVDWVHVDTSLPRLDSIEDYFPESDERGRP